MELLLNYNDYLFESDIQGGTLLGDAPAEFYHTFVRLKGKKQRSPKLAQAIKNKKKVELFLGKRKDKYTSEKIIFKGHCYLESLKEADDGEIELLLKFCHGTTKKRR